VTDIHNCRNLIIGGEYAKSRRSGYCLSDDGLPGSLSSIRCCGVSRRSAEPMLAEGETLVWNNDSSGRPHDVVWLDDSLGRSRKCWSSQYDTDACSHWVHRTIYLDQCRSAGVKNANLHGPLLRRKSRAFVRMGLSPGRLRYLTPMLHTWRSSPLDSICGYDHHRNMRDICGGKSTWMLELMVGPRS